MPNYLVNYHDFSRFWTIAQLVEHDTLNVGVVGSNPAGPTILAKLGLPPEHQFRRFFVARCPAALPS